MWTGLRLPRITMKLGIHVLRKLRTCDYAHKEFIFPAGPITSHLTLRQRHVIRRVSVGGWGVGLNCRREARKIFVVIVTFRMSSKNSPVLQHMLKMLPSWPNALSTTPRRRYLLSGVLPRKLLKCHGGCCVWVLPECADLFFKLLFLTLPQIKVTACLIRGAWGVTDCG